MDRRISRADFLKLLGGGALGLGMASFVKFFPQENSTASNNSGLQASYAQTAGSWTLGPNVNSNTIHVALLNNGKIFYVAGSGYHTSYQFGPFMARILDPNSGQEVNKDDITEDLFCCGFAHLANGNILIAGGTKDWDTVAGDGKWHGLDAGYEFHASTGQMVKVQSMAHGRWYPTCLTMADGKVLIEGGSDEYGSDNKLTEIYDPATKAFSKKFDSASSLTYCVGEGSTLPGAGSPCYGGPNNGVNPYVSLYPRMHLMPSGLAVTCGQSRTLYVWNPANGQWSWAGNMLWPGWRSYGTSVLLPLQNTANEKGKVLLAGGSLDASSAATNHCEILDFNASGNDFLPTLRSKSAMYMNYGRRQANPVILPNGKVGIFGGTAIGNDNPVMTSELFDPITETWSVLPTQTVPRVYHSVALLLPDGRVWTAGGNATRHDWELRTEFYSPSYLSAGSRPTITGEPVVGPYAGTITIPTNNGSSITSVSLVKVANATHHYNVEQRLLWLNIQSNSSQVVVSAPLNPKLAPPGYYMIHILNNAGVPSIGKIIRVPGTGVITNDSTPPVIRVLSPAAGSALRGPSGSYSINVAGTASDAGSGLDDVIIKIGTNPFKYAVPASPGNWSTWSFTDTISASPGTINIKVIATDKKNNAASVTIPITLST
jgi:galactose oxidase-like protein